MNNQVSITEVVFTFRRSTLEVFDLARKQFTQEVSPERSNEFLSFIQGLKGSFVRTFPEELYAGSSVLPGKVEVFDFEQFYTYQLGSDENFMDILNGNFLHFSKLPSEPCHDWIQNCERTVVLFPEPCVARIYFRNLNQKYAFGGEDPKFSEFWIQCLCGFADMMSSFFVYFSRASVEIDPVLTRVCAKYIVRKWREVELG